MARITIASNRFAPTCSGKHSTLQQETLKFAAENILLQEEAMNVSRLLVSLAETLFGDCLKEYKANGI